MPLPGFDVFTSTNKPAPRSARHFDKRREAVVAKIRADRERVGVPGARAAAEIAAGIGHGGAADVVPLAVEDHEQAALVGVLDHRRHRRHAGRAQLLEERGLNFHRRHQRRDHVDDAVAKRRIRPRLAIPTKRRRPCEMPSGNCSQRGSSPTTTGLASRRTAAAN